MSKLATKSVAEAGNSSAAQRHWYLVWTKPSSEPLATTNLERQGYRVYHPQVKKRVLRSRGWCEVVASLFPRYLFVQLNADTQALAPIRSTLGVAAVVRFGTDYAVVPDGLVTALMDRADPHSGLHCLRNQAIFDRGVTVRVLTGALAGIEGIFECEDANDRIVVLLNLLGRETRIKLPVNSVVPAYALSL